MRHVFDPLDHLRLFLVENDENIGQLICQNLERAGHRVTSCRTAAEALASITDQNYDLVLLDHHLPDMAGLELLQALNQENIAVPTVMVTAFGDEQLAIQALHTGALDYVVKDPSLTFLTELPKRIADAVRRHRLQQSNRLLLSAVDSAHDGIFITNLQGVILHVNRALEHMTGYTDHELCGQPATLICSQWPGAGNDQEALSPSTFVTPIASWQIELTNRRKDGSLLDVSLSVSPILDPKGQMTHFVGIQRDITQRKHLERQLTQAQKMHSIGTLAGGVAHEFNNLLAGISGYATLCSRDETIAGTVGDHLQQIITLSERAANLTRQLLTFARTPRLSRRPTPMETLLRNTADFVARTLLLQVNLNLHPNTNNGTPLMVEVDTSQIQQALVNLSLNAREALIDPEPITFGLRHEVLAGPKAAFPESIPAGDYALVQVVDTGCGMSPEVLSQALDPFYTTKDVGRGTGLGLPVAFGIVHAHQGYLSIDSTPGQGTTVSLYLPHTPTKA